MKKILISAGPTREKIDAVRFISNRSSGKMGYAIAEAARDSGYEVVLVSGPVDLPVPRNVMFIPVESAADMAEVIKEQAKECDVVIMAAAVADYRPVNAIANKLKKQKGNLVLELERTEDILDSLGKIKRVGQMLIGFAAETDDLIENATDKLKRKNLDWIVANDVSKSDRGFGSDENAVTLIGKSGANIELGLCSKYEIGDKILFYTLSQKVDQKD